MSSLIEYDIIRYPVVTEKADKGVQLKKYVFVVQPEANKKNIKWAFEKIFRVGVVKINVMIRDGKTRRFRGLTGKTSSNKIAVITVQDNIDLMKSIR